MKTDTAVAGIHRFKGYNGVTVVTQWTDLPSVAETMKAAAPERFGAYDVRIHKDIRSSLGIYRVVSYVKETP